MELNKIISPVLAIFKYSTRKILFNRRWVITLLIALLVGVIMGYAGSQLDDALNDGTTLMDVLILSFIMPIITMIYGTSLIRNEIEDRSITQVITAPLDRRIAYLGYYFSLAAALSLIMLVINLVGWVSFFAQQGMDGDSLTILGSMCLVSVIGALAYSALFLASGVFLKKPVYFGLFYAFIWESFIGSIPGAISHYTIKHFVRSIASGWLEWGSIGIYDGTSVGASIAVLAGVTIAFLVLGAMMFKESEYP
ncbi:MAG: ABC transporter permease [Thermoplasmata archaeon]|nr:ABC transporter permease [Thermoplasmata archaeon]